MSDHLDQVFADYPQVLSALQLGELLGVSEQMAYRWLRTGAVPGYKVAGSWVIYRDEVKEHLRSERADRIAARRTATDPDPDPDDTDPDDTDPDDTDPDDTDPDDGPRRGGSAPGRTGR